MALIELVSGPSDPVAATQTHASCGAAPPIGAAREIASEIARAKAELAARVSHALRTPLQSILGYSELGMARSHEHPRLNCMFGDVHAAGQRMLALMDDLLQVPNAHASDSSETDVKS